MSTPSRWLTGFAAPVLLIVGVWTALPLATSGADLAGNRWVHEGLSRKLAAARARHHKVALLGGSSVHFGLSARRLDQVHGMPAVNLGQHAGLGLRYILHYGRSVVSPGDVVVLSLEYGLWEREKSQSALNYYLLAHDLGYLYRQGPIDLLRFLAGVSRAEWTTLLDAPARAADAAPVAGYQAATIDAWGDETANTPEAASPPARAALQVEPTLRTLTLDPRAVSEVRAFADALGRDEVRVVVTFPGLLRRQFDAATNGAFYAELVRQLQSAGLQTAGTPAEFVVDVDCVFDTAYHQIQPCVAARTDRLAAQLMALGAVPQQETP